MKTSQISKMAGVTFLALSLTMLPSALPASAQNNLGENQAPVIDTTPLQESENEENGNWGWLGLLGLIGLANLFRKNKRHVTHQEPDVVSGPGPRY